MRAELTTEAVSRASVYVYTFCGAGAVTGALSEWTMALLGVPLVVALAAISGIGLVVSYQDKVGAARLATTVICSLFVACAAAVGAIAYWELQSGMAAIVAAAVGILLQIVIPWLIRRGPELLDQAAAILQARFGGNRKGDQ